MGINDWPEDQRPRERLIKLGAQALSDAELLSVFLRMGVKGKNAIELGKDMLCQFGSLRGLFGASIKDFSAMHGLGNAKYAQLHAVLELAKRAINEELQSNCLLSSPQSVRQFLLLSLGQKPHEAFTVLFLDMKNRLIISKEMFQGSLGHASVYPREVVKSALSYNAASVILAHNHPSGSTAPSQADRQITLTLKNALSLVDVRVLDHFIVAQNGVYSFAEHGEI
ncbi:MAG: DNA repair protein RadC [Undibacterium sp.]|nr:DNA repair protein RadC [Undibacterium sp.]